MSFKRKAATGGAILGMVGGLAALPSGASAWTPPGQVPPTIQHGIFSSSGPAPVEWVREFRGCPAVSEFPEGFRPINCVKLTAYDGELKLGKTVAEIDDPISLVIGIGLRGQEPVIVMPKGGGGAPAEVKIPGGILGQPGLDPLIEADPLGLLSVSATPQIGEAGVASNEIEFLTWLSPLNDSGPQDVALRLPLSIKLNNALFGDQCQIPEFDIVLENGGHMGQLITSHYNQDPPDVYFPTGAAQQFTTRLGVQFADESFAVGEAENCDFIQPVHGVVKDVHGGLDPILSDLGLGALGDALEKTTDSLDGLFDPVINSQVGLPAAEGNHARFKIDTELAYYNAGLYEVFLTPFGGEGFGFGPDPIALPAAAVGQTHDVPVTITNAGLPNRFVVSPLQASETPDFQLLDPNGCSNRLLQTRETCSVILRYAPASTGEKTARVTVGDAQGVGASRFTVFTGNATPAPVAAVSSATSTGTTAGVTSPAGAPAPKCLVRIKLLGKTICL